MCISVERLLILGNTANVGGPNSANTDNEDSLLSRLFKSAIEAIQQKIVDLKNFCFPNATPTKSNATPTKSNATLESPDVNLIVLDKLISICSTVLSTPLHGM